jgi:hypothetical protein
MGKNMAKNFLRILKEIGTENEMDRSLIITICVILASVILYKGPNITTLFFAIFFPIIKLYKSIKQMIL